MKRILSSQDNQSTGISNEIYNPDSHHSHTQQKQEPPKLQ